MGWLTTTIAIIAWLVEIGLLFIEVSSCFSSNLLNNKL